VSLSKHLFDLEAEWEKVLKKKRKSSSADANSLFGKVSEQHGYEMIKRARQTPGAMWVEKVGSPGRVLSIMGPVSDLLIVSRPASRNSDVAEIFMRSALLDTGRPVLIMPQIVTRLVGKRVCIAWNQSEKAAQAVAAAMPILQLADEVNIVVSGSESALGPKSNQLANYLRFWGIKPKCYRAHRGEQSEGILKFYKETKSDLLVMGAYSRSRLRERVFGGVTEHMLRSANIPVFMLHS
jgi:hypothetical protein